MARGSKQLHVLIINMYQVRKNIETLIVLIDFTAVVLGVDSLLVEQ